MMKWQLRRLFEMVFLISTLHPIVSLPLMSRLVLPSKLVSSMKSVIVLMEVS